MISSKTSSNSFVSKSVFFLLVAFCLSPWSSPPIALLLGILFALGLPHPFPATGKKFTTILLQVSVVGLGFGIEAGKALEAGKSGLLYTSCSIVGSLLLGVLLGKLLAVEKKVSYLISCGTAICGGSAIAAIGPIIKAEKEQFSIALGTVFILNSLALLVFPFIGTFFGLDSQEFGLWAAIAIHDTSSVVGTAAHFGEQALQYATTVKLLRTLYIIPLAFITAFFIGKKSVNIKFPYFILFFVLAILLVSYVSGIKGLAQYIVPVAKKGLTLTLFLIGTSLSAGTIKKVGFRPFIQGVLLWIIISAVSLSLILSFR